MPHVKPGAACVLLINVENLGSPVDIFPLVPLERLDYTHLCLLSDKFNMCSQQKPHKCFLG